MTSPPEEPAWVTALRSSPSCAPLAGLLWPLIATHPGAVDFFGIPSGTELDAAVRCGPALRGYPHVHGGAAASVLLAAAAAVSPGRTCTAIEVRYGRQVQVGRWYRVRARALPDGRIAAEMAEDGAHKPLVSAESAWAPSAGAPPAAKGPVADHEPAALSALAARYPQTGTDAVPEETYAAMLSRGYFAIRDAGGGPPVPYLYGLGAGPPLAAASYEVVAKDRTECWWRLDNGGGERGDECVHPGILFSLLDYCVSWAAGASIAEPTVTAAISIGFAPASRAFAGGWVRVVAGGQPSGPRRVSARGTLEDAEGRVLATAVGSFARFTVSKV